MLKVVVPESEYYDEARQQFLMYPEQTLELEHSLLSVSKWESKWEKPFLGDATKTDEETLDYVACMCITPGVSPEVFLRIPPSVLNDISTYVGAKMTATWFAEEKKGSASREVITSELVYYWMVALAIPFECENWHFNRLLTLIRVCNVKNAPSKKMSKQELLARNRSLNQARRQAQNTTG